MLSLRLWMQQLVQSTIYIREYNIYLHDWIDWIDWTGWTDWID